MLDMATTVAAYGKVKAKAKRGETMPEGWMIDREGKPLLDPKRADEGFSAADRRPQGLRPCADGRPARRHARGAAMGRDVIDFNHDDALTNTGQAILVIDLPPSATPPPSRHRRHPGARHPQERTAAWVDRIWLPGEQSHATRRPERAMASRRAGVDARLDQLADELGIARLG